MTKWRTGGEIDAVCTRCKMTLAHTIIAMVGDRPVRVQCNTCGGQHNYRVPSDAVTRATGRVASPAARDVQKTTRVRLSFEEVLAAKKGPDKVYSPKGLYAVDDLVAHPTFGRGYVEAVRADKVDVVFKAGTRTLVHGRQ